MPLKVKILKGGEASKFNIVTQTEILQLRSDFDYQVINNTFVNLWNVKGYTNQILVWAIVQFEGSNDDESQTEVIYCNEIDQLLNELKKFVQTFFS